MRIRIFAASTLVAAGLTAGITGVAAAGEPDDILGADGPVIVTCEDGVMAVRPVTPAERERIEKGVVRGERVETLPDGRFRTSPDEPAETLPRERFRTSPDEPAETLPHERFRTAPARPGLPDRPVDGAACSLPLETGPGGSVEAVPALPAR